MRYKTKLIRQIPGRLAEYQTTVDYSDDLYDMNQEFADYQKQLGEACKKELERAFKTLEPLGKQIDKQFEEYQQKKVSKMPKDTDETDRYYVRVRKEGTPTVNRQPFVKQPYYLDENWVAEITRFAESAGILTTQKPDIVLTASVNMSDVSVFESSIKMQGTLLTFDTVN